MLIAYGVVLRAALAWQRIPRAAQSEEPRPIDRPGSFRWFKLSKANG
jgi:hypothetical protein